MGGGSHTHPPSFLFPLTAQCATSFSLNSKPMGDFVPPTPLPSSLPAGLGKPPSLPYWASQGWSVSLLSLNSLDITRQMAMIKLEHSSPLGTSHRHCRVFQTKATEWITLGVVGYSEFGDGSKEVVNKGQHGRKENLGTERLLAPHNSVRPFAIVISLR